MWVVDFDFSSFHKYRKNDNDDFIREAGGSWLFYNTVLLEITVNRVITSGEGEVKGESSEVSHSVIAIECDASNSPQGLHSLNDLVMDRSYIYIYVSHDQFYFYNR